VGNNNNSIQEEPEEKEQEEQQQYGKHDNNKNDNDNDENKNIKSINNLKKNCELDDYDDEYIYYTNNSEIGKTIISDKHPNTIDSFWFALAPGTIVRPFDFVTVEQYSCLPSSAVAVAKTIPTKTKTKTRRRRRTISPPPSSSYHIKTIGMIQDLQAIVPTDNYNKNKKDQTTITSHSQDSFVYQKGITIARVAVMANSYFHSEGKLSNIPTGMPVGLGKSVRFSNTEEVTFALGIPEMAYPIPAGIIEMSNGLRIPIFLDISYLAGPDTVHVNASGISGNAKTSYLLFLLQSVCQKLKEYAEEYALIMFNTKCGNLLRLDKGEAEMNFKKDNNEKESFDILNLDIAPFDNVTYFLPRGRDGRPNSTYVPENSKTYSYELEDVYDRLDLLFLETNDPHYYNLSSIVNYIYEFWPIKKITINNSWPGKEQIGRKREQEEFVQREGKVIKTWTDLFNFKDYPEEIITNKSSLLQFQGYIQRFRRSSLFIDKKVTSTYLGKEIKQICPGDVFVIDIAMLSTLEEQAFVIGDAMKSIDEMYSALPEMSNEYHDKNSNNNNSSNSNDDWHDIINNNNYKNDNDKKSKKKPKYLLIFIDEINRFLPNTRTLGRINAVAEQIMKTIIAGRSRHTILFSAQQFKSTVDYSLHENTGMHIIAKVGLSELSSMVYNIIDESTKKNIVRLNKGELVMTHSAFRHPIKITFPNALLEKKL
jgi:hypothetical protein